MRFQLMLAGGLLCGALLGCSDFDYTAGRQADEREPMLYRNVPQGDTPSRNPAMNNSGTGGQDSQGERTGLLPGDIGTSDVGLYGRPANPPGPQR